MATFNEEKQLVDAGLVRYGLNSAEWDALTDRRTKLIVKKYEGGITGEESDELARLQRLSSEVIESEFPRPRLSPDELAEIKRALAKGPGEHRE